MFPIDTKLIQPLSGILNSIVAVRLLSCMSETLNFDQGIIARIPVLIMDSPYVAEIMSIARDDWNNFESSWDFNRLPWLPTGSGKEICNFFNEWWKTCQGVVARAHELEVENNKLYIEAYGLTNEVEPNQTIEQVTLTINPRYRYGRGLTDEEYQTRFRSDTIKELLSYSFGCMMGRYSLDKPGLIYANAGNEGFDPSKYKTFPADDDGIVPVCDMDWFPDDATPRLVEFIKTVFGAETLDENLVWIAESFEPKKGETPVETIRRYFSTQFFKNHIQMYKKRPIYWLFSSGKQKAFECLVYLHRYNESTLARMRAQYVTPLQGKLNARIEHLRRETDSAGSTAAKTKLRKEVEMLVKKQTELAKFDEELRHYADQRIKLDLDDGVRVNYGKFGSLLAETKAITGGSED